MPNNDVPNLQYSLLESNKNNDAVSYEELLETVDTRKYRLNNCESELITKCQIEVN